MKNVQGVVVIAFIAIVFSSCNGSEKPTEAKMDAEKGMYTTTGEDKEMNNATDSANKTFSDFEAAWKSGKYDHSEFAVKLRFPVNGGNEHIWADSIDFRDGKCFAVIANTPEETTEVKLNDRIEVKREFVSDWKYVNDGKLIGGFTIRVERKHMSDEERKAFDSSLSYKID